METIQTYPADYLGKQTLTASEDRVVINYRTLLRETTWEFTYSELGEKSVRGREGDIAWTTLGVNIFFLIVIVTLPLSVIAPTAIENPVFVSIIAILGILAALSLAMRFAKFDTVKFYDNEANYIFEIKIMGKSENALQRHMMRSSHETSKQKHGCQTSYRLVADSTRTVCQWNPLSCVAG